MKLQLKPQSPNVTVVTFEANPGDPAESVVVDTARMTGPVPLSEWVAGMGGVRAVRAVEPPPLSGPPRE